MRSIDWLTISQEYRDAVPLVGSGWVYCCDSEGTPEWEVVRAFEHEGSHDTRIRVRASGNRIEWSGNPSRFNRPDNVWGYTRMPDVLVLVNAHLHALGLPPMTAGTGLAPSLRETACTGSVIADGAQITRVDLAAMFACGDARSRDSVLGAMSQVTHRGDAAITRPGSVSWGSSRYRLDTVYDKARELRRRAGKSRLASEVVEYREALADYLDSIGALRHETKLGRDTLRRAGLRALSQYDDERANAMCDDSILSKCPEVGVGGLDAIADYLISEGVCGARQAHFAQGLAYQWAAGEDVFSTMSRPSAYRYRAILRTVGIDIRRRQVDVRALHVRPRVVTLSQAQPPSWYRHAA